MVNLCVCPLRILLSCGARRVAMAARREAVASYLAEHHQAHISWHITLNNHASTRSRAHGEPLVKAVTDCKTYTHVAPGSASAAWQCSLNLPNSFNANDGIRLQTEGYGCTQNTASEDACRQAVIYLLMTNPSQVILQPKHWNISPSALLEGLPGTETVHQALPVHVPARSREAGVEAQTLSAAQVDERVADILRRCLYAHGGEFDPSKISSKDLGQKPGEERVYYQLNKLILPGRLRPFIDRHPEFSWTRRGPGMLITWAPSSASASSPELPVASTGATDANAPPSPPPPLAGAPPAEREPLPIPPPLPRAEQHAPGSASASGPEQHASCSPRCGNMDWFDALTQEMLDALPVDLPGSSSA